MHRIKRFLLLSLAVLLVAVFCHTALALAAPADRLTVSGAFLNAQSKPVKEVGIEVLVNGQAVEPMAYEKEISSGSKGAFSAVFELPAGTLPVAKVEVKAHKPSWEPLKPTPVKVVEAGVDEQGNRLFESARNFTLARAVTAAFWLATLILLGVYVIISFEWMHRTLAALLAAALILFITYTLGSFDKSFFILSFEDAMGAIDLNVIFLLLGMMIFVGVLKKTGVFQFLAYKSYAWARGNVFVLAFVLQFLTAVITWRMKTSTKTLPLARA